MRGELLASPDESPQGAWGLAVSLQHVVCSCENRAVIRNGDLSGPTEDTDTS